MKKTASKISQTLMFFIINLHKSVILNYYSKNLKYYKGRFASYIKRKLFYVCLHYCLKKIGKSKSSDTHSNPITPHANLPPA